MSESNPSKAAYRLRDRLPGVITAATAALAVGYATRPPVADANAPQAVISAEPHHAESPKKAVAKLDHTYIELAKRAEAMANDTNSPQPSVNMQTNPTTLPDGLGDVLQMRGDAYSQLTGETQVCVVSVYKPDKQGGQPKVEPYSIFEVDVYTGYDLTMPTSPDGFDQTVKKTYFSFSLTKGLDEEWNVATSHGGGSGQSAQSFSYNTAPTAGELSVERNQSAVDDAISEAAYMLNHLAQAGGQLN